MTFHALCRKEDVSHIRRTGHVAEVAELDDGAAVVRWLTAKNGPVCQYDRRIVHGHEERSLMRRSTNSGGPMARTNSLRPRAVVCT